MRYLICSWKQLCEVGIITLRLEERIGGLNLSTGLPRSTVRAGSRLKSVWAQSPSPSCHVHCSRCTRTSGPSGRAEGNLSRTMGTADRAGHCQWEERGEESPIPKRFGSRGLQCRADGQENKKAGPRSVGTGNLGTDKLVLWPCLFLPSESGVPSPPIPDPSNFRTQFKHHIVYRAFLQPTVTPISASISCLCLSICLSIMYILWSVSSVLRQKVPIR